MSDMKLYDTVVYSVKYLKTQRIRSWLTIIGIVIGIATVISLLSVSQGMKMDVERQLSAFGGSNLMVIPVNIEQRGMNFMSMGQRATSGKLFERDYDRIKNLPGVEYSARVIYARSTVSFREKSISSAVFAGDVDTFKMWGDYLQLEKGRFFTDNDRHVVVLGYDAANELFGDYKIDVNNRIEINGVKYRVVGILRKIGTSMSKMDDSAIYIPYKDGREMFKSSLLDDEINIIMISADDNSDVDELAELVKEKIMQSHHVTEDDRDFSVMTSSQINEIVGSILNLVTLFIIVVAGISAVVGGIGISNTMFMSVLNRTREIGVLKSLGATDKDIMLLFLVESLLLGLIGGLLGMVLGLGIIHVANQHGISAPVDFVMIFVVILFAALIGVLAGVIPAKRAARIPPVEALKY